jgi:hypothetical protein
MLPRLACLVLFVPSVPFVLSVPLVHLGRFLPPPETPPTGPLRTPPLWLTSPPPLNRRATFGRRRAFLDTCRGVNLISGGFNAQIARRGGRRAIFVVGRGGPILIFGTRIVCGGDEPDDGRRWAKFRRLAPGLVTRWRSRGWNGLRSIRVWGWRVVFVNFEQRIANERKSDHRRQKRNGNHDNVPHFRVPESVVRLTTENTIRLNPFFARDGSLSN